MQTEEVLVNGQVVFRGSPATADAWLSGYLADHHAPPSAASEGLGAGVGDPDQLPGTPEWHEATMIAGPAMAELREQLDFPAAGTQCGREGHYVLTLGNVIPSFTFRSPRVVWPFTAGIYQGSFDDGIHYGAAGGVVFPDLRVGFFWASGPYP
jgi:hypothetical protein